MTQQRKSSIGNRRPFRAQTRFLVAAISGCFVSGAIADPATFTVVNGTAVAVQAGKVLTITNSAGAILNWNKFGIAAGDTTHFQQTSASSAVLNRVLAGAPISEIYGTLSSNGRVWLINPSGILVGASGRVDTAGFVASTLGVTNSDFLAGRFTFGSSEGNAAGIGNVVNQGAITTSSGGSVYLVAPNVTNQGIITTPQGETILAAGQTVQLIDTATPGVKVEITGAEGNATNLGEIVADAGRIGIAGVMVRNSGSLNASSVVSDGGRVFLKASQDAYVDGAGRIVTTGTKGGSVEVLGNRVAVMDSASIDASGTNGGGSIKVGGDYQGKNPEIQNSMTTYFGPDASLRVDATSVGAGGTVIVWADDTTRAYGRISARGGAEGGDGGFVETSGKRYLAVDDIRVDTRAPQGRTGTWLLDPSDIAIVAGGSTTASSGQVPSNPYGGVTTTEFTTGSGSTSTISDTTINNQLTTTDVVIHTAGGTGGNGDITVTGANIFGDTNAYALTLAADGSGGATGGNITVTNSTLNVDDGVTMLAGWTGVMPPYGPDANTLSPADLIDGRGNITISSSTLTSAGHGVYLWAGKDISLTSNTGIQASVTNLEAGNDITALVSRIGGITLTTVAIDLKAGRDVSITSSAFETSGGAMSIDSGRNFTLTANTGGGAILSTAGCALTNSFNCRNENYNFVQGGLQTVTANNGTIKIEAPVGGGNGVALFSAGGQNITAANIEIRGGLVSSAGYGGNDAWITNRSSSAGQTISAHTILLQAGGQNSTLSTDRDNDAGIYSSAGLQTINVTGTGGTLTLNGGAGGHNNAAVIQSKNGGQVLNVHGAVSINGGNADGTYQNFAEISSYADQTINIYDGGSITINGGAGNGYGLDSFFNQDTQQYENVPNTEKSSNLARIALNSVYGGSPHTQTINFVSGGMLSLFGGSRGSNNYAEVVSDFGQTITGNPDVLLRGGASGGAGRIPESPGDKVQGHERSNHAGIFGGDDDNSGVTYSNFALHSLTMEGGGNANSYGGAGIEGFNLTLNVVDDVTLIGGASNTSDIDDVPNATSAVHLTVSDSGSGSHLLIMNVGGDLNVVGGSGSSGLAFVGSGGNAAMNIAVAGNIHVEAEQVAASKAGIGSLFGIATGSVLVGGAANVSAQYGGIAVIGSHLGPMLGMPYPPNVTSPGVLPPLLSGGDVGITNGLTIDAGASIDSAVSLNANGKIIVSGARVGGTTAYGLGIYLNAGGNVLISNSALETNGSEMNIVTGGDFTLTATTGNGSIVSTAGCSAPNSVDCRTGPYIDGGLQVIEAAGTVKVEANAYGGFGVALFSGGGQSITADRVEVLGGVSGPNNDAYITNRSPYNQEITAHTIVLKAGGTANTDENNDAVIYSSAGTQFINVTGSVGNLGSLAIYGGAAGHGNTAGIVSATGAQNLDVHGSILVQGGGNTASYQNYAGIENNATQTINIFNGGSVVVRGGAGGGIVSATGTSDNYASIKTTSGNQTIDFKDSGGHLDLFGGSVGNGNFARIWNSGAGVQTITGNPDITMTGGDSGGASALNTAAGLADPFYSGIFAPVRGNNAMIAAGQAFGIDTNADGFADIVDVSSTWIKGTQSIDAASITIKGSSLGVTSTGQGGAGLFSAYGQTVNVVGALQLLGGNATGGSARSRTRLWSMGGEQDITANQLHVIGATSGTNNISTVGSWGNQTITLGADGTEGPALWLQTNGAGATNVLNNSLYGSQTVIFSGNEAGLRIEGPVAGLGTNGNFSNAPFGNQHISFMYGGSIVISGVNNAYVSNVPEQTRIYSTGNQEIVGATSITLTAGSTVNSSALIGAHGDQHIETNQLTLTGGSGNAYDSFAAIEHGGRDSMGMLFGSGAQTIVLTGTNATLTLQGGSGNGQNPNDPGDPDDGTSENVAKIKSSVGEQFIAFAGTGGSISVTGGSGGADGLGNSNGAGIISHYGQTIGGYTRTGVGAASTFALNAANNPNVLVQGGSSGGANRVDNNFGEDERGNDAGIFGGDNEDGGSEISTLNFKNLTINGGTALFGQAGVGGDHVSLTVTGNAVLTGGTSSQSDPNSDVPDAATAAYIAHDEHGSLTMTVGGNLTLMSGSGTSGMVVIGSVGMTDVNLTVGGDLMATAGVGAVTIGSLAVNPLFEEPQRGGATNVIVHVGGDITLNGGTTATGKVLIGSPDDKTAQEIDNGQPFPPPGTGTCVDMDGCIVPDGTAPVHVELVAAKNLTITGATGGVTVGVKQPSPVDEFDLDPAPSSRVLIAAGAVPAAIQPMLVGGDTALEASVYGGNITTTGPVVIKTDQFSDASIKMLAFERGTGAADTGSITLATGSVVDGSYIVASAAGNLDLGGSILSTDVVELGAGWNWEADEPSMRGGNVTQADTSMVNASGGIYIWANAGTVTELGGNVTLDGHISSTEPDEAEVGVWAERSIYINGTIFNGSGDYYEGISLTAGNPETYEFGGNVEFGTSSSLLADNGSVSSSVRVTAYGGSETAGNIVQHGGSILSNYVKLEADGDINVNGSIWSRYELELTAGLNRHSDRGGDVVLGDTNPTTAVTSHNRSVTVTAYGGIDTTGNITQNAGTISSVNDGYDVFVYADGDVTQYYGGQIVSDDELRIVAGRNIKIDGRLEASDYLTLFAGGDGSDTTVGNIELGASSHLVHHDFQYVWAAATGDLTLNGSITSTENIYGYAGYSVELESASARGGNLRMGADSGIVGSSVYLKAFGGIAPSSGNISQDGGSISANQSVEMTADRDVMLNGSVGNVGTFGYANVEITAGALGYRGGSDSETSLGGNILLDSNSAITAADVDLRTYQPTGATTFSTGNISQTAGGQIDVTYVTSLHAHAAGNVELLGSIDVPNSSAEIYAGYDNTKSESSAVQVFANKHITVSDLNAQSSPVTLSATGPISATIDGASTVTASIANSSAGGISITASGSGSNLPMLDLQDNADTLNSVSFTRAQGDLDVTDDFHLNAGATGAIAYSALNGNLKWETDNNVYGGSLSLSASGAVFQVTPISVASLSTSSGSGTMLNEDNVVNKFSGSNSGTGEISFISGSSLELGNINNAQSVTLASLGAISQTGIITAGSLSTVSVAGTELTSSNIVAEYSGANSGAGNIAFTSANGGGLRLVELIVENQAFGSAVQNAATEGNISITSAGNGNLHLDAAVVSNHAVNLTSAGGISQSAAITSPTLSTTSVSGTELTQSNFVATFTGNNSATGNLNFKGANANGLVVAGGNNVAAAGDVSFTSVGSLTISGNVASAHDMWLSSGGAIAATGNLSAFGLGASAVGGAAFTGANHVKAIIGISNSGAGDVTISNAASPLNIMQINNTAGNVVIDNTGAIVISGTLNALGTIDVTAHSPITVTNTGAVTAGSDITLTASAATPTSSGDALVVSGSLSSTGGIIALVGGSVILGQTSQISATYGGSVEVDAIGAQGDIFQHGGTISSSTDVSLIADRNVNLNGQINAEGLVGVFAGLNSVGTTGGNISVGAASNVVADDIFLVANRDTGTGSFTTGNVSQQLGSTLQTGNDFLVNASGNIDLLGTVVGDAAGRTNLLAGFKVTTGTEQAFTGARVTASNLQANGGSVSIQATAGINAVVQSAGVVGANINNSEAGGLNLTSYGATALVLVDNSLANSAINLDYRNAALTLGANSALVTGSGAGKVNVTANGGNLIYSGANVSANGVRFSSTGNISQTAPITTNVLYTSSYGGTALSLDNVVGTYSGMNSGSGNLVFKSIKAGGLTLAGATSVAVQNLAATGDINITSAGSGSLTISGGVSGLGNVSFSSAGAISALANLTAVGLNSVSVGGASYSGANHFANVTSLTNTGSGNVVFNNTATPLTIAKMTNSGGNITVDNLGKVVISGEMNATGSLSVTAHSPLTVASTGSVTAGGDLSLIASSTSAASTIDLLTIDGSVLSNTGNIALFGGSGIVVTKAVTATNGNVSAQSPYGDITQTPDKLITAPKGKVEVSAFAARPKDPVVVPPDTIPDPDPVKDLPRVEVITSLVTNTSSTTRDLGGNTTGGTAGTFGGAVSEDEKKEEEKKAANGATTSGEEKPAAQRSVGTCT